jgi:hypothetical protein
MRILFSGPRIFGNHPGVSFRPATAGPVVKALY